MPSFSSLKNLLRSLILTTALPFLFPLLEPAQAVPASNPQTLYPAYILNAGDRIEVTVFGYDEYTGVQTVLPDGTIILPVIGSIQAAGRTPDSLAEQLTVTLRPYLVDPVVTVRMDTLRPVVVNVTGEVQRPGPIQLRSVTSASGSNTSQPSLEGAPRISSALVEAGGVTTHANIRQIEVRRTLPDGESRIVTVDLWDAVWSANAPEDLILQDGDSIYVHRLPEGEDFDRRLLARSSLAPQTIRVRVVGEVTRPGEVQVSPDGSISSAVAIAGGPTQDARLSRVELIRLNQDGTISNQRLDLSDLNDSIQVQEGDVVIVPERGDSSFFRVLGRALGPIGSLLGIFDRITNLGF